MKLLDIFGVNSRITQPCTSQRFIIYPGHKKTLLQSLRLKSSRTGLSGNKIVRLDTGAIIGCVENGVSTVEVKILSPAVSSRTISQSETDVSSSP